MKQLFSLALLSAFLAGPASAQWLPAERQAAERKLWEATGVELPSGMRFYELPAVSQALFGYEFPGQSMALYGSLAKSPNQKFPIYRDTWKGADNVNQQMPWATPSGLHNSPRDQWRKVAAAYFPGRIKVWIAEPVMVANSGQAGRNSTQPAPQIQWAFPDGTLFAEMLIRTHHGREWPFEIRQYELRAGKMMNGETYRPDVPTYGAFEHDVPPGKLSDFGFKAAKVKASYTHADAKAVKLKPTREVVAANRDDSVVPRGFLGNVRTCTDCHQQAGKPTSYGATTIRGSGQNLSWNPFRMDTVNTDADPILDARWNLDVQSTRLKAR